MQRLVLHCLIPVGLNLATVMVLIEEGKEHLSQNNTFESRMWLNDKTFPRYRNRTQASTVANEYYHSLHHPWSLVSLQGTISNVLWILHIHVLCSKVVMGKIVYTKQMIPSNISWMELWHRPPSFAATSFAQLLGETLTRSLHAKRQ